MSYTFFIARRYLFSRKSMGAINIISAISMIGVAVATMALVCTLSVFNGFHDLVSDLFTAFDPELLVRPARSSTISADSREAQLLARHPDVAVCTPVVEDQALVKKGQRQQVVTIKGVADNYALQASLPDILYPRDKEFCLQADGYECGIVGIQLAERLGLSAYVNDSIEVNAPKKGKRINPGNPRSSFRTLKLLNPGVQFQVMQSKYDCNYILTSLPFAQHLFDREGTYTAFELRLREGASISAVQRDLKRQLGEGFTVLDRYEQQHDVFSIMNIEKLLAYIFLTFILLVASFNIIASLSMLMIEKRSDADTLRSLGATDSQLARIFTIEGCLISLVGAVVGLALGLALCFLQQHFGLIRMGESDGSFIVDAYPVSIHLLDLGLIFLTVLVTSWLAVWFPSRRLARKLRRNT